MTGLTPCSTPSKELSFGNGIAVDMGAASILVEPKETLCDIGNASSLCIDDDFEASDVEGAAAERERPSFSCSALASEWLVLESKAVSNVES